MNTFLPTDILLPKLDSYEKWSVIACDQFTSQPEYWESVKREVENANSSLQLILPESELQNNLEKKIELINKKMNDLLSEHFFEEYSEAMIYVERILQDGSIRRGVIGAIDLEQYDYHPNANSAIRATEKTVLERIPPREKIRENAPIELPHILLLCDDDEHILMEHLTRCKLEMPLLYDFDLMQGGGRISGWLVKGEILVKFRELMKLYEEHMKDKFATKEGENMLLFVVGDGNHSLATAKSCYEKLKKNTDVSNHPARYALVELGNIHDEAQKFEPIHRIIKNTDPMKILERLKEEIGSEEGESIEWYSGTQSGCVRVNIKEDTLVDVLQSFMDRYLLENKGEIDYIHGEKNLYRLARKENNIGFLLPSMEKRDLFLNIASGKLLPRKTFSMGHAKEKRYYLEARKIR